MARTCQTCKQDLPDERPEPRVSIHYDRDAEEPGYGWFMAARDRADLVAPPSWHVAQATNGIWVAEDIQATGRDPNNESAINGVAKEWEAWANGDVYGYNITDVEAGEILDSCWGFYDFDHMVEEINSFLESEGFAPREIDPDVIS